MKLLATPKLPSYTALVGLGLAAGLVLGRPEPVVLVAPFFLALLAGLLLARAPILTVSARSDTQRAMEGDEVGVELLLAAETPIEQLDVLPILPRGLELTGGRQITALHLSPGEHSILPLPLTCVHWGGYQFGEIFLRVHDPLRFFIFEARLASSHSLRVYPHPESLRSLPSPAETQVFAGNRVARTKGDGLEFADVRPFVPGDRVRRINWRLSTQRRDLYVNEFHQERNADVVVFLDAFIDVERDEDSTHLMAVRGAATVAEQYLVRRDRVGVVGFGGTLRWLRPAMGVVQRYRIVESLIDTDVVFSYAWKGVEVVPPPTLPTQALVIAFSPLLDERAINALFDLRARGFDLAIVDVSPVPFAVPAAGSHGEMAFRLWKLERAVLRYRFQRLGVAVAVWERGESLERALGEVQAFRRYARQARA